LDYPDIYQWGDSMTLDVELTEQTVDVPEGAAAVEAGA